MISMRFVDCGAVREAARSSRSKSLVTPLEEATLPEVVTEAPEGYAHHHDDDPERVDGPLAGDLDVHPEHARDQGQRQQDDAEGGEDAEEVVGPVGEHRLV